MIKFKRLTIALAALLITSATAWAAEDELLTTINASSDFTSGSKTFDDKATVTFSGDVSYNSSNGWCAPGNNKTITATVTAADGYTVTRVRFYSKANSAYDEEAPFEASIEKPVGIDILKVNNSTVGMSGLIKMEVYGHADAPSGTPVAFTTLSDDKKSGTFTMPKGNVQVIVEYEPAYTATFKALTANTIQAGKATVTLTDNTEGATPQSATPDADGKLTPVYEGQTITLTAQTGYKFRSVTAKKGSAAAAGITNPEVGQIIGSDGINYAANATLPSGVTKVAMIAYLNGTHGLALQLNATPASMVWAEAKTYAEGLTAVPGCTWSLPSKEDWQNMFVGCAVAGDAGAGDMMSPIFGFKEKIAATGITFNENIYWTSTGSASNNCYVGFILSDGYADAGFNENDIDGFTCLVLGCLAF